MENKETLLAVYGSLRPGKYNYKRFSSLSPRDSNITLKGYKMFDLGAYPAVIRTNNILDTIVCDVIAADDMDAKSIDSMEYGAGYHKEEVNINGKTCALYVHKDSSYIKNHVRVLSGDWNKYSAMTDEEVKQNIEEEELEETK